MAFENLDNQFLVLVWVCKGTYVVDIQASPPVDKVRVVEHIYFLSQITMEDGIINIHFKEWPIFNSC